MNTKPLANKKIMAQLPASSSEAKGTSAYQFELEALAPLGVEKIHEIPPCTTEEFIAQAKDADALLCSWGIRISREIIEGLDKCVHIAVGSVGVDMVDIAAATEAGIVVTNTPDVFIEETADHTMALLLASARRLKMMDDMVRRGDWRQGRPEVVQLPRLWGQTLGLLAFGNISTAVARRAKPFGMHIIAHDPYVSELKMTGEGVEPVSFSELLERSDYLSVHPALNDSTRHIMSDAQFAAMKKGAVVINAARGGVIDEEALVRALQSGQIGAAGLDVLEEEPPRDDHPLFAMDNVILTPHSASGTSRMRPASRRRVGHELALVLSGRWPMSPVNPTVMPRINLERWQPYPMGRGPNR
ncbi:MAG: D-3-phosphoglycerate dehydrogenase [Cellvibrionaceae bacterium]|jgi:D-3-phosphoglycerate dehydrogenase